MRCKDSISKISAYIDNELSREDRESLSRHLAGCPACKREHDLLLEQARFLRQAPAPAPSPDFRLRFWQQVEADREKGIGQRITRGFPLFRWIPAPIALSLMIIVFSTFSVASPLLYGVSYERVAATAKETFLNCSKQSVLAPLNFVRFCDHCVENLCACGSDMNKSSKNCRVHGGMSHD